MNLILHQFKTDTWHFRWQLSVLWLSFAAQAALTTMNGLSGTGMGLSYFLLELWQIFFGLALIVSLVQADPLVGTSAGWLARPMRRNHLFWAKSAFIVVCLFVPRLIIQILGWALRGYSPHLILVGVEESLLYSVAMVSVVAVLASLTRDFARFFLAGGITIGFIFGSALIVEILVRSGVLTRVQFDWPEEARRNTCAEVIGWLVLGIAALLGWILQARAACWRAAAICLAVAFFAFPVIATIWARDFLKPRLLPSAPLTLSLVGTNQPWASGRQNQFLSTQLSVDGVPDRHVVGLRDVSGSVRFLGDNKATSLRNQFPDNWRNRPAQNVQQSYYIDTIEGFFPTNTLWFNERFGNGIGDALLNNEISTRFPKGPPPGDLDGEVSVDLYAVKEVAELPLRFASVQTNPGLRVTIQKVRMQGDIIGISIDECSATLMFDRNVDTQMENFGGSEPACTYVLYHPQSGEAYIVSQRNTQSFFPALTAGDSHQDVELSFGYPALRERFAGISASDWLSQARLCVFTPVYAGTSRLHFHQDDYHWPWGENRNIHWQKEKLMDNETVARATLPPNPTTDQLNAYLDEVLLNVPNYWDDALNKTIKNKLEAIGASGLPALLQRLPLSHNVEMSQVLPVISKLVTRDRLPELRAALQRDDNLVTVFEYKHWEADARDILVARLSDHRQRLSADGLRIAAEAKSPATYADLRWHFVRLEFGQDEVLTALKQCPGFDTAAAIREAWQFAQLGMISPEYIAPIAAAQGLPGALNSAVTGIQSVNDAGSRQQELDKLASLAGYTGPKEETFTWLVSNLGELQFDPAAQRYVLQPAH